MDIVPITASGPVITFHTAAAVLALALGPWALGARRRGRVHRLAGRFWVGAMALTAITAFGIFEMRVIGPASPIHLLAVLVLWMLWRSIAAARAGRIVEHGRIMAQLYVGALLVPGAFTFLPGRRMNAVLFGGQDWAGFALVSVVFASLAVIVLAAQPARQAADKRTQAV